MAYEKLTGPQLRLPSSLITLEVECRKQNPAYGLLWHIFLLLNYPHEASDDLLSDPSKDLKTEEGKDG